MSTIKNDVLAPQFKFLNCALWYDTRAHCATRLARLLMPQLVCCLNLVPLSCLAFGWFDKNVIQSGLE